MIDQSIRDEVARRLRRAEDEHEHTVPPQQVRHAGSKEDAALSALFRRVLRDTWG
jgi:hypothetical protein